MLHIVKQLKKGFSYILFTGVISHSDAINIADIADTNNTGKIDWKELNALLKKKK